MSVNLGQCIVTLLGHNWDLIPVKLLHFNFEWIVFCDLVSCKDNFILHKSDFSCLIWQYWNKSGTTMWPQAIGTSHPNFGMHTGSQGPNPAIFSQNCPNRAMLPGSYRTGNYLTCPENSKILEQSLNSGHPIVENDFKILDCCDNLDIRTLEYLYIHKLKPSLNDQHSSKDLFIVHW